MQSVSELQSSTQATIWVAHALQLGAFVSGLHMISTPPLVKVIMSFTWRLLRQSVQAVETPPSTVVAQGRLALPPSSRSEAPQVAKKQSTKATTFVLVA